LFQGISQADVGTVAVMGDSAAIIRRLLQEGWVRVGITGSHHSFKHPQRAAIITVPHPRSYGTFPRKIGKYAIEDGIVKLEDAIRSSSGLPADILKLTDRGYLKPKFFADVVVFDAATIADRSTYEDGKALAVGVEHVFVNGTPVLLNGDRTSARPGRGLKRQ